MSLGTDDSGAGCQEVDRLQLRWQEAAAAGRVQEQAAVQLCRQDVGGQAAGEETGKDGVHVLQQMDVTHYDCFKKEQ